MNLQHLGAFFWLRWRLFTNQLKRGGIANVVILAILAVAAVLTALFMFAGFFMAGLLALPGASPSVHMYVWDGLVLAFLFWWTIGILTDLQRSEALSLEKFLHLPVSLTSAFLINYLSSLLSLSMIVFLPAMVGLIFGLVCGMGPAPLLLLPLLAALLFTVTALTYQFQGWLASLMANKRRRQTILVMITMSTVVLCQLPNVFNILHSTNSLKPDERLAQSLQWQAELRDSLKAGQITLEQFQDRLQKHQNDFQAQAVEQNEQTQQTLEEAAWLGNVFLPPGWLPLGAMALAESNVLPALLGTLGLTAIGSVSMWRAYRTTVRLYTGQFSAAKKSSVQAAPAAQRGQPAYFLEKKLPWVSEPAAAIALACFRSLLRAPEAKMMLLTPLLMVVIFGSMFLTRAMKPPDEMRPLLPFGAMGLVLFSMVALVGNQFGFDRNGFRVYVLCPARRQDILLGKNLAIAPLALGLGTILAALLAVVYPMRLDHLLAAPAQLISMFLLFCLMANWLSILVPMAIRAGSLKAAQPKGLAILLNLAFMFLFPLALVPTLLPLGIEVALHQQGVMEGLPICLALTLAECVGIGFLYRLALRRQGDFLQRREQAILQLVSVKSE